MRRGRWKRFSLGPLDVIPLLAVVWGMITHETFGTPQGRQDPGVVGWLAVTVVVVLVGVMLWLMASRRLLAYIIEVEDSDDSSKS